MTEPTTPALPGHGHSPKARNTAAQQAAERHAQRIRIVAFGAIAVVVLAVGGFLAFGDFLKRAPATAGAVSVQSSMAGFTPAAIHVKAGQTATLDWWTDDAAMHLQDGVHTMISPELGLYETLPAESRKAITWQVPDKPGTYDVYCDSCCGGKDSPTMHGTIVVEA
ncbi:MAG: cupredoxin domain-containing protein [Chloroflexota bacterium]